MEIKDGIKVFDFTNGINCKELDQVEKDEVFISIIKEKRDTDSAYLTVYNVEIDSDRSVGAIYKLDDALFIAKCYKEKGETDGCNSNS